MVWALTTKTWREHRRGMIGWALGLAAITGFQLSVYPSVRSSAGDLNALLNSFPDALIQAFRITDYTSGAGYLGAELFSIVVPLSFIAMSVNWACGATATEEERGTADLLLTLPVSRDTVVLGKTLAILSAVAGLALVLWLVLLAGCAVVDLQIGAADLFAGCAAVALLGWIYAGVGLLAGALTGRRGIALGSAVGLAFAGFLLYSLGPLVDALKPWLKVSPFEWALGDDPLRNGVSAGHLIALLTCTILLTAAAAAAFRRRDIGT